jgi:hypothetical protein
MKRKRQKRITVIWIRIITYMFAVFMLLFYTSNGMAANDAEAQIFAGLWQIFIVVGLLLHLRWQRLGALVVMGTTFLQGVATMWLLSLFNLAAISVVTGALAYVLPMLVLGIVLWRQSTPPIPPHDDGERYAAMHRDFSHLEEGHEAPSVNEHDEVNEQGRRLQFAR